MPSYPAMDSPSLAHLFPPGASPAGAASPHPRIAAEDTGYTVLAFAGKAAQAAKVSLFPASPAPLVVPHSARPRGHLLSNLEPPTSRLAPATSLEANPHASLQVEELIAANGFIPEPLIKVRSSPRPRLFRTDSFLSHYLLPCTYLYARTPLHSTHLHARSPKSPGSTRASESMTDSSSSRPSRRSPTTSSLCTAQRSRHTATTRTTSRSSSRRRPR